MSEQGICRGDSGPHHEDLADRHHMSPSSTDDLGLGRHRERALTLKASTPGVYRGVMDQVALL